MGRGLALVEVLPGRDVLADAEAAGLALGQQVPEAPRLAAVLGEELLHAGHAAGDVEGAVAERSRQRRGDGADQRPRGLLLARFFPHRQSVAEAKMQDTPPA